MDGQAYTDPAAGLTSEVDYSSLPTEANLPGTGVHASASASASAAASADAIAGLPDALPDLSGDFVTYDDDTLRLIANLERRRDEVERARQQYFEIHGHADPDYPTLGQEGVIGLDEHGNATGNGHALEQIQPQVQPGQEMVGGVGSGSGVGTPVQQQLDEQQQQHQHQHQHQQPAQHDVQQPVGEDAEYKPEQPQQYYKKRQKLVMACHFCRRRKLKCDGVRPQCSNCEKRTEPCLWDDLVRRRGPGKRTKGLHPEHYDEDGQLLPEFMSKAQRRAAGLNPDGTNPMLGVGGDPTGANGGEMGGDTLGHAHEYGHEQQLAHAAAEHGQGHGHGHEGDLARAHEQGHHGHHEEQIPHDPDADDAHSALADPSHGVSDTNAALIAAVAAAARDTQGHQGLDGVGIGVGVGVGNGLGVGEGEAEAEGYEELGMGMIDPALAGDVDVGGMASAVYDPTTLHVHDSSSIDGPGGSMGVDGIIDPTGAALGHLQQQQQQSQQQQQQHAGQGQGQGQEGHGIGVGVGVGYTQGQGNDGHSHSNGHHDAHGQAHETAENGQHAVGEEVYEAYGVGEEDEAEDPFAAF